MSCIQDRILFSPKIKLACKLPHTKQVETFSTKLKQARRRRNLEDLKQFLYGTK